LSEFVSIDEESNHEIMHALRLGEAQRATDEPLDPGPQLGGLALDLLRVRLATLMLLGSEMPLVGPPPAFGGKLRDAKRCQSLLELQADGVLPSSEPIRPYLARLMIKRVPQPPRVRFAAHVTSHSVEFGGEPPPSIQLLGATNLHGDVLGLPALAYGMVYLVEVSCFFFVRS